MDTRKKTRAGVAGGLAALALVIGGASIASGDTSSASTASPAATTPQRQATPGDDGSGHRPCPHEGGGFGSQQQQAPATPSTTTNPET